MNTLTRKLAAILLVAFMVVSIIPSTVFAAEGDTPPEETTVAVETTTETETEATEPTETTTEDVGTSEDAEPADETTDAPPAAEEPAPVVEEPAAVPEEPAPVVENTITSQPQDAIVAPYQTAVFAVEVNGKVSSYKWEYSTNNGKTWWSYRSDNKASISVIGYNNWWSSNNKYQYRCVVTFKNKKKVTSEAATLFVSKKITFKTPSKNKAKNADVTADAPEGTFPDGTSLVVSDVRSADYVDAISNVVPGVAAESVTAVDISFKYNGEEVEPANDNQVTVTMKSDAVKEGVKIVHIDDNGVAAEVPAEDIESIKDGEIVFRSDAFSVYAVIGEGETGENARLNVVFKNGETELARMLVKQADTTSTDYDKIVYDPGVGDTVSDGQLFRGWTLDPNYDKDTTAKDIDAIREDIAAYFTNNEVKEGDELVVYAMVYHAFTVTYKDGDNISIGSTTLLVPASQSETEYTINQAYTAPEGHHFEGWLVEDGSVYDAVYDGESVTEPPYQNGTTCTLRGDVIFSVNAPAGQWLVFHENKGTYVAPQFIMSGNTPTRPNDANMKRLGYTFDDWYADEALTTIFDFNQQLSQTTHAYAKWNPKTEANYTVLIWKQNVSGDGYDFADSKTVSGTVGDAITINTTDTSATVDGETYSWTGFTFKNYDTGKTIATEGNTIVNVYFDRITVTLRFYRFNWNGGFTQRNDSSAQEGIAYYGRFDNYGRAANNGGNYYPIYYIDFGGGNYRWCYPATEISYWGGSYISYDENSTTVYLYGTTSYWGNITYYNRYIRNGNWLEITDYRTSGLYGSSLADNNYTWPTDYDWYSTQYPGGGVGGTRTTFLDAYLPSDGAATVNFYGETVTGTIPIRFHKQNADLNGYTLANTVYATAGTFYISDKYNGFTAYEYAVDGGENISVGEKDPVTGYYNSGEAVSYTTGLDIYFNRDVYSILYMDGAYVDGNGNPVEGYSSQGTFDTVSNISYGSDTSSYNEGGANYYDPTEDSEYEDFVFGGWYIDDKCTHPYTFTTMPEGLTVYAKWVQSQYRVFLHPNVDPSDTSLNWGSTSQAMNFRISAGSTVSAPTGTRDDFQFVGWFLDEGLTEFFNADLYILNDESVTTPYDKSSDFTDPMDKYGNGATTNADVDRYWITKKLDLYGSWRAKITGAEGIGVVYDAVDGTNPPTTDTLKYLDQAKAVAQAASTAPAGQRFLYWVVQKWNGTAYEDTNVTVYPGDTFTVLKSDAREQDITDGTQTATVYKTYTVQLRAEYGQLEAPVDTHITWYANGGEYSPPITGDNIYNTDVTMTNINLKINEAVNIPGGANFTRDGYKFLGWAKEPEPENAYNKENKTVDASKYSQKDDVTLWLKYNEATGTYDEMDGETVLNDDITQVAADEQLDYHSLYAVWEKNAFYVYHSATGELEAIDMADVESDGTYDLTSIVSDNTLYGGYFSASGAVTAENVEAAKSVALAADDLTAPVEDAAVYNGTSLKNGSNRFWDKANAYTTNDDPGDAITPEKNAVYYLKEVPTCYLQTNVKWVYNWASNNKIEKLYFLTGVDDSLYSEVGYYVISNKVAGKTASAFSFQRRNDEAATKITASQLIGQRGYIGIVEAHSYIDSILQENVVIQPYWTTLDGVTVSTAGYTLFCSESDATELTDDNIAHDVN